MEPLIRLRLLSSRLDAKEKNVFVKKIIDSFGVEQMMTIILSDFIHHYNCNYAHNVNLYKMIKMVSKIIDSMTHCRFCGLWILYLNQWRKLSC